MKTNKRQATINGAVKIIGMVEPLMKAYVELPIVVPDKEFSDEVRARILEENNNIILSFARSRRKDFIKILRLANMHNNKHFDKMVLELDGKWVPFGNIQVIGVNSFFQCATAWLTRNDLTEFNKMLFSIGVYVKDTAVDL